MCIQHENNFRKIPSFLSLFCSIEEKKDVYLNCTVFILHAHKVVATFIDAESACRTKNACPRNKSEDDSVRFACVESCLPRRTTAFSFL